MSNSIREILKYSEFISNKGNKKSKRKQSFEEEFEEENFTIKNNKSSVLIGESDHGKISFNGQEIIEGGVRCLTVGTSGSGKSYLTRNTIERLYSKRLGIVAVIDPEGEYYSLRKLFDFVILGIDEDFCDIVITEENAAELAIKMLKYKINVIIDLKHTDDRNRQEIASKYIDTIIDNDNVAPLQIVIEEASRFASKGINTPWNIKCTASLKKIAQFGRKREISAFYNTQRVTQLHKDISAECNTIIVGRCTDDADIKRNAAKIGLKDSLQLKKIKHEFYAWGDGFDHYADSGTYVKFTSFPPNSEHKRSSRRDPSMFPYPESETVMRWIGLMGGIVKGGLKQILAKKDEQDKQLSLLPEVKEKPQQAFRGLSDKIESIPKKPTFDDDDLPDSLSEACEICGKTAVAHGRCNNCADYEAFGMDPSKVQWNDEDDDNEDEDDE